MIIGFTLIIIMLMGMALFAINRLNKVAVIYSSTLKYPISIREAIIETQSAFNDLRMVTNRIIAYAPLGDPARIDNLYKDAVSAHELAVNTIQELENLIKENPLLNEEERSTRLEHSKMLRNYVQRYKKEVCDPIMNAARIGDYDQCIEITDSERTFVDETKALVITLRDMATSVAERSGRNALETANQSKTLLVIASVVSVVISVVLAILIAMLIAAALRAQESAQLTVSAMFNSNPHINILFDDAFRVIDCNPEAVAYMGVNTKEELLDKLDGFLSKNLPSVLSNGQRLQTLTRRLTTAAAEGEIKFETELHLENGIRRLSVDFRKIPYKGSFAIVAYILDITEIFQREAQLAHARELADAANRAKSTFLANMSHELRTPLNVVIGLTGLIMEDERLDKRITDNLVKISNAGNTLLSIVNDILDFSKIESGKLSLTPVEYYVSSLLNDIITLTIARLGEKPIQFHLNINDDLPNKLYGDDIRVKQVFTNLLTNAVKYTREGSIGLSVHCVREGDTVWLDAAVSDTGIGMHAEDMKNLFFDYFQADSKSNRNIEGTGLGLAITRRLAEMMGGKISVESEYGKGSTFCFRIKQGFVDGTVIGADVSDKLRSFCYSDDKRIASQKLARTNLNYARVLVVDDMETNLDVASGILSRYKMQVDCLTNGPAAIERIRDGTPVYNAIFMDHMMPGMDGIETADRIRALGTDYAKNVPIIALTANAIRGTENMFYEHDFQAFITKPIDVMEMDAVLRKWVRDKNREEAPVAEELSEADRQFEKMAIEIPGVDTKKGLALYAGSMKIYLPLLRSYVSNTPKLLDKLRSVSAENLPDYVINVHGLKGTSAGIGAEAVREAASELENISRAGGLQGVLERNGKLIAEAEALVANIKAWLLENDVHEAKPRLKAPDKGLLAKLRQGCESYNMASVDEAMSELEKNDYEEGADLILWLREKIETSDFAEAAERIVNYGVEK